MDDYKCDRCGWSIRGALVETHLNPRELGWATEEMMAACAEMTHLLASGCMGSLVEDTWFTDVQLDWIYGRRGIPLSKLPPHEQAEILDGNPIQSLLPSYR